jgi:hypothetical protein
LESEGLIGVVEGGAHRGWGGMGESMWGVACSGKRMRPFAETFFDRLNSTMMGFGNI